MIIDYTERSISGSKSPIKFILPKNKKAGNVGWTYWYRYLAINGKRFFETGNVCGTCNGFFRRLPGDANRNSMISQQLSNTLNAGLTSLDNKTLGQVEMLVPNGDYYVFLRTLKPQLCKPGAGNDFFHHELAEEGRNEFDPETSYFRLPASRYKNNFEKGEYWKGYDEILESLVPIIPENNLDMIRVEYYRQLLRTGEQPTVFALGMFDNIYKDAENRDEIDFYNFLTNYIVDGHHKAYAAALENKEVSLLTYVRKDNLVSTEKVPASLIQAMREKE